MKFYMSNRKRSSTNKETIIVLTKYFYKVYNRSVEVDWNFLNAILHDPIVYEVSGLITLDNLNNVIGKLA